MKHSRGVLNIMLSISLLKKWGFNKMLNTVGICFLLVFILVFIIEIFNKKNTCKLEFVGTNENMNIYKTECKRCLYGRELEIKTFRFCPYCKKVIIEIK
jgi:hypothetical protein